jgi:hypothetical protein
VFKVLSIDQVFKSNQFNKKDSEKLNSSSSEDYNGINRKKL